MDLAPETATSQYIVLDRYLSLAEAELARSVLEGSGVDAVVRDAHIAGLNWYYIPAIGGVRVEVPASQWDDAQVLAEDPEPIEWTEAELSYLETARNQRRALGMAALGLTILSVLAPVVMAFVLVSTLLRKKDDDGGEEEDGDAEKDDIV